jgi:aspartate aminotransferase-like enzyme
MKDRELQSQQAILKAIAKSWADFTFADVQSVFQECMERLTWVAGNNGEYYPK